MINFNLIGMPPAAEPFVDSEAFEPDVVDVFDMDALIQITIVSVLKSLKISRWAKVGISSQASTNYHYPLRENANRKLGPYKDNYYYHQSA